MDRYEQGRTRDAGGATAAPLRGGRLHCAELTFAADDVRARRPHPSTTATPMKVDASLAPGSDDSCSSGVGPTGYRRGMRGLVRRAGRAWSADAWGDRVDDRRAVRSRLTRRARLGGADRRRGQGQGPGAVGLQDRQDRRAGVGAAVAARSRARDLAARPVDPSRMESALARKSRVALTRLLTSSA